MKANRKCAICGAEMEPKNINLTINRALYECTEGDDHDSYYDTYIDDGL